MSWLQSITYRGRKAIPTASLKEQMTTQITTAESIAFWWKGRETQNSGGSAPRTSILLFCISIFFGQWGWFYSITAEHYLLYFDKMKPSPWDFFTHCSLGYFTAVLFHYLLIFQHAVCIAVIYTSSDSPQRFLTPQGEIMEFTWDTKGRQQVLQKRWQIDKLDSQRGNWSIWSYIMY